MPAGSETLTKWEPVGDINFDFVSAEVYFNHSELWVRLVDGRLDVAEHLDLVFHFAAVAGYAMHEEFAHPSQGTVWSREPVISDDNKSTFPCLIVAESEWFERLRSELDINYEGAVQYRPCSNFPVIDVISARRPAVRWLERPSGTQDIPGPSWAAQAG